MDEERLGRRNVVAGVAAGAVAVLVGGAALAPDAEARKRKQPPLGVVAGTIVDVLNSTGGTFTWVFHGAVMHVESGTQAKLDTTMGFVANLAPDHARKQLLSGLRLRGFEALKGLGLSVPSDRIAVTLI
jgi:hypothetical protein